jgi:hypothetical protein
VRAGVASAVVATVAAVSASGASAQSAARPCVFAWNHDAKPGLRASIAARGPQAAFIAEAVILTKADRAPATKGQGCMIQFFLPNGQSLSVWGSWTTKRIMRWIGPVERTRTLGTLEGGRSISLPSNGRVLADGSVAWHR